MNFFQRLFAMFGKHSNQPVPPAAPPPVQVVPPTVVAPVPPAPPTQPVTIVTPPTTPPPIPQEILQNPIKLARKYDTANFLNGTTTWGDWRDVQQYESPAAYFKRTGLGGYGKTTEQLREIDWNRQPENQRKAAAAIYGGPIPVGSLSLEDCGMLLYAEENYKLPALGLFYAVCSGKRADIALAIGLGDSHRFQAAEVEKYRADPKNAKILAAIDAYSKGELKPVVVGYDNYDLR